MIDLDDIRTRSKSLDAYIEGHRGKDKDILIDEYEEYSLNETALQELKAMAQNIVCVVFSAPWCGDCKRAIPVLKRIEEETGLEIRVFGDIKTAPLDPNRQWAIPPSPPEMEEWGITHIPWIVFFDRTGKKLGTVVEKPEVKDTLEEEIVYVLKK
ncbi:hypothetical protein EU538_09725 [Candidatus Thorarchaeota archaeon]|nr:MAG: hypothetical protein EU538_09725 [Candidatus Thorarchaeota archaeon]